MTIFDDAVMGPTRGEGREDVEIEDGYYEGGDRVVSSVVPSDFVWCIDPLEPGTAFDESLEAPVDISHGQLVSAIQNLRFVGAKMTPGNAIAAAGIDVHADEPNCPFIEHPDGSFAVDGRLQDQSDHRFAPGGRSIGGRDFLTLCGVFVITDLESSFWVGGTDDAEDSSECGRFTFRYQVDGEGIETGWRVNGTTHHHDFGLPSEFEAFQVTAVICELNIAQGEMSVFHHGDLSVPFGDVSDIPTGNGLSGDLKWHFNSTHFNEGGTGGIAYHLTVYDRALTAAEKETWVNYVDNRFDLGRDVRYPSPPSDSPYGISDAALWLDATDTVIFEDQGDEGIEEQPSIRKSRPEHEVRIWYDRGTGFVGLHDGDAIVLAPSGDYLRFDDSFVEFEETDIFESSGLVAFVVARFSDMDDNHMLVSQFQAGTDGAWYLSLVGGGDELGFTIITDTDGRVDVRDGSFDSTGWHIFRAEYDDAEARLYVDDAQVASEEVSGPIQNANNIRVRVGAYDGSQEWRLEGDVAEVVVFPRMLATSEIDHVQSRLVDRYAHLLT